MPRYIPEDSLQSPRFTGPSTFARLPYVRTLEEVDVAIVGVPFDTGVTYRVGGRFGPNAVRAASVMLRPYNANLDVKPFEILSCVDYGDVAIVPGYTERSYEAIEAAVAPIVEAGVVPLLIGGDHACTLPHLRATRSRGPVAVIDFDSHTDAWDSYFGEKYNHGTWMRRAIEEGLVDVAHSIEVGLRGSLYGAEDWTGLRSELGLDYLTTEDVFALGPGGGRRPHPRAGGGSAGLHQLRHRRGGPGLSRPGTGTPEAGGPSAHDMLVVLRGLTGIDFVGFDVVEVIPAYDPGRPDRHAGREPGLRDALAGRAAARRRAEADARRAHARLAQPDAARLLRGRPACARRPASRSTSTPRARSSSTTPRPPAGWTSCRHQAYGPRTGVPRILRVLDRQGIRATFFVPGYTAERWPDVVRAIRDAGHEIGHHGYLHEGARSAPDAETEERRLLRGLRGARRGRRRAAGRLSSARCGSSPTGSRPCWPGTASCTTAA